MTALTADQASRLRTLIKRTVAAELSWQRNWPKVTAFHTNLGRLRRRDRTNIELENFICQLEGRTT
jgi:hypothetical protein